MPSRASVWLQFIAGWLPVWAMYMAILVTMHGPVPLQYAALLAVRAVVPAALLGLLVNRLAKRVPWPRPFQWSFLALHIGAAATYSMAWLLASRVVDSLWNGRLLTGLGPAWEPFVLLGLWLYVLVAGVSYALDSTRRAAAAEASAAKSQLAALRAQLHPHFLFNALHTVVQLIPRQPERAASTAERVAELLRVTIREDRDLVTMRDEWSFVSRYLDLERVRFGDRLRVVNDISDDILDATVPSFAIQTLVENAVRHGAAPRVAATTITIRVYAHDGRLTVQVKDTGDGPSSDGSRSDGADNVPSVGSGLARLRERLRALYGTAAELTTQRVADGFVATLELPRRVAAEERS